MMGEKLNQIHLARVNRRAERLAVDDASTQRRRDNATANIQMRIIRKLVNLVNDGPLDYVLHDIECLRSDWDELVATLNAPD